MGKGIKQWGERSKTESLDICFGVRPGGSARYVVANFQTAGMQTTLFRGQSLE